MKEIKTLILLCVLCPSIVFAFPGGDSDSKDGERMGKDREQIMQELGLTQDQKDKLKALKDDKEDMHSGFSDMKKLREDIQTLLRNPSSTEAEILTKSKEMADKMAAGHEKRIKHLLEMRKILTPEQFGKLLDKMHEKVEGKFGSKFGK